MRNDDRVGDSIICAAAAVYNIIIFMSVVYCNNNNIISLRRVGGGGVSAMIHCSRRVPRASVVCTAHNSFFLPQEAGRRYASSARARFTRLNGKPNDSRVVNAVPRRPDRTVRNRIWRKNATFLTRNANYNAYVYFLLSIHGALVITIKHYIITIIITTCIIHYVGTGCFT